MMSAQRRAPCERQARHVRVGWWCSSSTLGNLPELLRVFQHRRVDAVRRHGGVARVLPRREGAGCARRTRCRCCAHAVRVTLVAFGASAWEAATTSIAVVAGLVLGGLSRPRAQELASRGTTDLVVELISSTSRACPAAWGKDFRRGRLQLGELALHVLAQDAGDELVALEETDRRRRCYRAGSGCVVALALRVPSWGYGALQAGAQEHVAGQVRVGVRPRSGTRRERSARRRGCAPWRRGCWRWPLDLIGRLEVRVQPAVRVHAGVEHQADVIGW